MITYERFKEMNINTEPVGFILGGEDCEEFCTPVGAEIIGWAGVDGIHYCFVKGFGDTVFSVNPTELKGDCVHPIAENFEMFLRLILSCGSADAVEQVHGWNSDEFDSYLLEYPLSDEQKNVLCTLKDKLGLQAVDKPFEYIKNLQAGFDYSNLEFKTEYFEDLAPYDEEVTANWAEGYLSDLSKRKGNCGNENVAVIGSSDGPIAFYYSSDDE
ncbi:MULTISPECIES: hypothetical protein [unclassified Ruminococcus]|uniref:hypothetical protein n=1 Tax=unclassified Ruminococcus TaxID=2608920 RepID=UPI00210EF159|nr:MULTISPECIES: hypothetical protein [unclassified Ruminococcus]MCQ4022917.1 hypothetical protein [Ruminococcus sp. zg-924]MCQ4115267.1 hypothetical protein [Ruminococcus sp. zg-921]